MQMIVIFNSFSDTACPKFKFLYNITTVFKASHFLGGKQYNFDRQNERCISQGSAVTFLRCGCCCRRRYNTVGVSLTLPHPAVSSVIAMLTQLCSRWWASCDVISGPMTPVIGPLMSSPVDRRRCMVEWAWQGTGYCPLWKTVAGRTGISTSTATVQKYVFARQYACIN